VKRRRLRLQRWGRWLGKALFWYCAIAIGLMALTPVAPWVGLAGFLLASPIIALAPYVLVPIVLMALGLLFWSLLMGLLG